MFNIEQDKLNLDTIKQILLYGIVLSIFVGISNEIIDTNFPSYGDIFAYFIWFGMFIFKAILFAIITIILLKGSYLILRMIKKKR